MSDGVAALIVLAAWALLVWRIIRADAKDQAAHDRWMNDPARIWNGAAPQNDQSPRRSEE